MLTWIKGEPLPDGLVDDILRTIGLERDTLEKRRRRSSARTQDSFPCAMLESDSNADDDDGDDL